jgi:hypothetical protein
VVEVREDLRLAQEARLRARVELAVGAHHLERDAPFQGLVDAGVDLSHSSAAHTVENPVVLNAGRGLGADYWSISGRFRKHNAKAGDRRHDAGEPSAAAARLRPQTADFPWR